MGNVDRVHIVFKWGISCCPYQDVEKVFTDRQSAHYYCVNHSTHTDYQFPKQPKYYISDLPMRADIEDVRDEARKWYTIETWDLDAGT